VTTDDAISLMAVGACVAELAACVLYTSSERKPCRGTHRRATEKSILLGRWVVKIRLFPRIQDTPALPRRREAIREHRVVVRCALRYGLQDVPESDDLAGF
jgi:hypothetical protein